MASKREAQRLHNSLKAMPCAANDVRCVLVEDVAVITTSAFSYPDGVPTDRARGPEDRYEREAPFEMP